MASASETTITRMINHVLETSEKMVNVVEEGISILLKGEASSKGGAASSTTTRSMPTDFEEDVRMPSSPLEGIADSVLSNIMKGQARPETFREQIESFIAAIQWTEPFIMSLLAFHVVMLILCIRVTRADVGLVPRLTVMMTVGISVRLAEWLNQQGSQHWKRFATQNYFDERGIFAGLFFSGPLLIDSFIMLVLFLREASQLLIQVKKEEFKRKKTGHKESRRHKTTKEE